MNPEALADRLRACAQRGSSGVAVQVLDHALVREAVAELARAEIPVVTVCTDIAGVDHLGYFGLDNRAAGRTAGLLMGRFCRGTASSQWCGAASSIARTRSARADSAACCAPNGPTCRASS